MDVRAFHPRFSAQNLERNLVLVDVLARRAAERGLSPAQLALAWLLASGPDVDVATDCTRSIQPHESQCENE